MTNYQNLYNIIIMGKNFKQRAAYHMLHSDKEEKHLTKHQWSCKLKWWRHNCEVAEDRVIKNSIKNKIAKREFDNDLNSLDIDK